MRLTRRSYLALTGMGTFASLAGCTGSSGAQNEVGGQPSGGTSDGQPETATATGTSSGPTYGWQEATWDAYWYSLYNMSTNIAMSANGVVFPNTEAQTQTFQQRVSAILEAADRDETPIKSPNLNMAPFTEGDPHFTQEPVFDDGNGRPDAPTLTWDKDASSGVVSPASVGWSHLKGVTWAKNFQNHSDLLPPSIYPRVRAQVLSTLAQLGIKFSLVDGNLRENDENLLLVSGFSPTEGVVDDQPKPDQHAAMLWFLSDMTSLATGGWFGYEHPEPLIPAADIQQLTDGMGKTVMSAFPPETILDMGTTRDLGLMLGAMGWYGTHAGSDDLQTGARDYTNSLADALAAEVDSEGALGAAAENQAATQGVVGQGLLWASEIEGVDRTELASEVLDYLTDELWDPEAGTFASAPDATTYTITARDAGDITGGLNAADAVLGMKGVQAQFAQFFNQTFNRGRLQRAERPPSRNEEAEFTLPLPRAAGGEYGQSAVSNAAVTYETDGGGWSVTDASFDTEAALYLANQDIWVGQWGGAFFQGRGRPGRSDSPA